MNNYRRRIDEIDDELMALINERYSLTKKIGEYKRLNNLPVNNPMREEEVLKKAEQYLYSKEIKDIYQKMFQTNKSYQVFEYGLIGKSLPYTLSPMIYEMLGLNNYQVMETDDFKSALEKINFKALNITIPYKEDAYHYCTELDVSAKLTKAVNFIYNDIGYNTDFLALTEIFKNLKITNEKVTIIGNGATSRAVQMALNKEVSFIVRTKKNNYEYLLDQYEDLLDTEYLINTTPYGTYPNLETKPLFPLTKFKKLKMVIDVIYNPLNSPLIMEAKRLNIKTMNGLDLLIKQANLNYRIMTNGEDKTEEILKALKNKLYNIVLIGLSYSGKSTMGKELAKKLNKTFIDTDYELARVNHNLENLINDNSISVYREYELELAKKLGVQFNQVIATGGGMVLNPETMRYLSYNSIIIHLDVDLKTLKDRFDNSRPLLKNVFDLEKMYHERKHMYEKYRMITIDKNTSCDEIMEKIYEYLNN